MDLNQEHINDLMDKYPLEELEELLDPSLFKKVNTVSFLNRVVAGDWKYTEGGKVDVDGSVIITGDFEKLPVVFGNVTGSFSIFKCENLMTLVGCPDVLTYYRLNRLRGLTTLEGGPSKVIKDCIIMSCDSLLNLKGAPKLVGGAFSCANNKNLNSLEGCPHRLHDNFSCDSNPSLNSLEGGPVYVGNCYSCKNCGIKFSYTYVKSLCFVKEQIYN